MRPFDPGNPDGYAVMHVEEVVVSINDELCPTGFVINSDILLFPD